MTSKIIFKHVTALLNTAEHPGSFELSPLEGGVNNRIFLVLRDNRIIAILKQYYHHRGDLRDRLSSDYGFSRFLWDHGIHQIPMPFASDPLHHHALFSYIDGQKMEYSEITGQHINQVIDFYFAINTYRTSEDAGLLPSASEACFSLTEHIRLTENRVQNLKKIRGRSETDKRAEQFIQDELLPMWKCVKYSTSCNAEKANLVLDQVISNSDKRLSPSDFGFHNALVDKNGKLFFMDFEYAGWDDPAKMVCDLFCQPQVPIPQRFYPYIIEKIVNDLGNPDMQRQRIEILLPVYKIKWCCIILNEFLPRGRSRRAFMKNTLDPEVNKEEQLHKAMNIFNRLRNG
jgi:hypothetical protein